MKENGDGTYTLALNVTGSASSSSSTTVSKSNIILVVDTSNSMYQNYTTYNGTRMRRLVAEKHVLCDDYGIIDQMLAKNTTQYPDLIEVAVVNFDTRGAIAQTWTHDAATLKSTINGLGHNSGTNWEEGLSNAKSLADSIKRTQPNEEVYIIFLTDGEPTTHKNSYNVNTNYGQEWGEAKDDARDIITAGYHFYGLFTWGSGSSSHYLSSLVQYAYTGSGDYNTALSSEYEEYFCDATDTDALINKLVAIVDNITQNVGYTNVELEDGITTMTASSVSTSVGGDVTGIKYYRSGGSYGTADPDNGNYGTEWTDAPKAKIKDGKVDWDLDDAVLEDGVTYTITFVVWPSQASLDLVADLNNGKRTYESLTDDEKASIAVSGGVYSLKTNTDFPTITYSTITTTNHNGEITTVTSEPTTMNITNPAPVGLAGSEMAIQKIWAVDLQTSRLQYVLYNTDGTSKELTVTLDIFRDNAKYGEVTLGWDEETEQYIWADEAQTVWEESFAVAPGVMVSSPELAVYAKNTITFGDTTYYILETGHDYELRENDFKDYHFDLVTEIYHPMIVDGKLKNVKFTYSGTTITGIESITPENGEEELSSLDATNTLRGGINLNKVVFDPEGNEYPTEDEFEFTIQLNNDSEVFVGDSIPWYSVNENYYHDEDGNYISEDEAKAKYGDDYENYGNVLSGSATSVSGTITITCVDKVRIANVPVGTTYTIIETEADGFTLTAIDQIIQLSDGSEQEAGEGTVTLDSRKIVGEIVPNRENNVTFKNKMNAFPAFYVYHSSDNTIEKIFVNDTRVTRNVDEKTGLSTYTFNIVNETKEKTLYGGYFKAYKGAGMTDAQIIAAKYESTDSVGYAYTEKTEATSNWTSDSSGKEYDGATASQWSKKNAYKDEIGLEMSPKVNTVYYLKEIPREYFGPSYYYVYDRNSGLNDLKKLYLMVPTDDALYQFVCGQPIDLAQNKKLYGTFKVTNDTGDTESFTVNDCNSALKRGYLTVWDGAKFLVENQTYKWTPNFVTLDGVEVTSYVFRTISTGDLCHGNDPTNFSKDDKIVPSTVKAYVAETSGD